MKGSGWARWTCSLSVLACAAGWLAQGPAEAQTTSTDLPPVTVEPPARRRVVTAAPAPRQVRAAPARRRQAAARPPSPQAVPGVAAATAAPVPRPATIGQAPPAYAGGQVAGGGTLGILGQRSILDTPFSVTNYTEKLIRDQNAQSVADVLKNDASVRNVDPTNVGNANYFVVRGIQVGNAAIAYGGLFGIAPNAQTTLAGIERVEVLKGPGAFLGGLSPSGVGAFINLVPKRAADEPLTRVTTTWMSKTQFGTHLDVGRRFGAENEFGVRANVLYRDGGTPIHLQSQTLFNGTLGLDYRGDRARMSIDLGHQVVNTDRMNNTVTPLAGELIPRPIRPDKTYVSPWNYSKYGDSFAMGQAEYDVTDALTIYAKAGVSRMDWDQQVEAGTGLRGNGNFNSVGSRYLIDINRYSAETGLRGRFQTGPLEHEVVLAANTFYQARASAPSTTLSTTPSNIYFPTFSPNPVVSPTVRYRQNDNSFSSFAISDTISALDKRVQLTLGLRQQYVDIHNYTLLTGVLANQNKSDALTPVVGLVVKPWENVSLYASYIEGLTAGTVVGNTFVNRGQVLPPFVTKQYEAGVKVDWGRLLTTVAVFESTQASGIANTTTNTFSADGQSRFRGIELNLAGEVTDGLRALGGVTLMDAELTRTANGIYDGRTAQGVPKVQANLGLEWDPAFVPNLTLFGRVLYTGSNYVDAANLQKLKPWTTFDLGARYRIDRPGAKPITIQANVTNLFNTAYWSTYPGFNLLYPSDARTVSLSTTVEF